MMYLNVDIIETMKYIIKKFFWKKLNGDAVKTVNTFKDIAIPP